MNGPSLNCSVGITSMSNSSEWFTIASLSSGILTPLMENINVGGCMPPSASPLWHSTPALNATSASPVQSMTVFAMITSRPSLLSMKTPLTSSPSLITPEQNTYIRISTPTSSSMAKASSFTASGSMIVRLTWFLHGLCSEALPLALSLLMSI